MPEAAVLEREAAPPDTGTEEAPTGATPSEETGTEREAQTGQEPSDENVAEIGDSSDDEEDDPEAAAIEAKAEALAEKKLADKERERQAQADAEAAEREATERTARHAQLYPSTVQGIEAALKAIPIHDSYGNVLEWTPAMLDTVTAPFKAAHLTIWQDSLAAVHTPIQTAIKALIPEAHYEDFKKEASGKPPEDYFRMASEYLAPTSKWAKSLSLDDAKGLSPKLKAEINAEITEGVRKKIAKGVKGGEPSGGGNATPSGAQPRNMDEARSWHVSGRMSNTQFRAYQAAQE